MPEPDFEKLRADRNKAIDGFAKSVAEKYGWDANKIEVSHDPHACYCACPDGPCEHKWDGEDWESECGCAVSVTCSRCGTTAMSHDMRVGP